jgi:serine phosphatase RsbU (regulator of sigma subunit)/HAMP domain-containing protein
MQAAKRTSTGAIPTVAAPSAAGPATPAPSGRQPAPAAGTPQAAPRPIAAPKTQGMPIKTKIIVAMSMLTVGVSLLIFVVVMMIATSSLEDTIQQAGVGMLQQAEAIQRPYKAGLNETGLISYMSQPINRDAKFGSYWKQLSDQNFHPRIPACRWFANWDQFKADLIWVRVADDLVLNARRPSPITEQQGQMIFGDLWEDLKRVRDNKSAIMAEPPAPRRLNDATMESLKHLLSDDLRRRYTAAAGDSWMRVNVKMQEDIEAKLIHAPTGIRRKIFSEFHADFSRDLDEMTTKEGSQVRYVIFLMPPNELPGFDSGSLNVISPKPEGTKLEFTASGDVTTSGDIRIDRGATVKGIPAYGFSKDLGGNESISIYLDRQEIQSRKNNLLLSILGISVLGIGLAVFLAFLIGGSITKPLQTLMHDIQVISGGNFDHRPAARSRDEIGIVARLLGDMAAGLKSAQAVWLENQGRKHDLDIAKEIQENLLPKHVPRIAGYDVSAYYSPSKEVGGDYYDFFLVDKTHLGMVCADVSGKGIPGSMVMMMAKALISYEAQDNLSPRDIFCKVNRTLAKDIKRGMFVTAFYMLLDIPTARLTVASAGHNPLLLYRAATKQCVEVNPGGIALGFDKDGRLFERNMKEEVIQLQRGDRAVIFTDGVTEAMSPTNEEFGEERMQAITIQAANRSSSEYLTALVNAIQGHAQTDEQHDDITIVTLKVG